MQGPACACCLPLWTPTRPFGDLPCYAAASLAPPPAAGVALSPPPLAPPRLDALSCREAIERHTTDRCYLPGSEAQPVLPEFPNVAPSAKTRLSGSNGVVPAPLRTGAGAPQAVL